MFEVCISTANFTRFRHFLMQNEWYLVCQFVCMDLEMFISACVFTHNQCLVIQAPVFATISLLFSLQSSKLYNTLIIKDLYRCPCNWLLIILLGNFLYHVKYQRASCGLRTNLIQTCSLLVAHYKPLCRVTRHIGNMKINAPNLLTGLTLDLVTWSCTRNISYFR